MKYVSILQRSRQPFDVKMTPMIDVVFLLLVFFVWTASFQVVEHVLPSQVSEQSGTGELSADTPPPPEADFSEVVVRLIRAETLLWRVNEIQVGSLADLRQQLEQIFSVNPEAPIIVHPDPEIALGDVIDVYDQTRQIGFEKIQFAVSSSNAPTP